MKRILVPIDGSEYSHRALIKAKELGTILNSEITILYVMSDLSNPNYAGIIDASIMDQIDPLQENLKKQTMKLLETKLEIFKNYNHEVNTLILQGVPGNEIIKEAESENYDIIVIGSRGLGAISSFILGGVSNKVVNNSKISVLVVK